MCCGTVTEDSIENDSIDQVLLLDVLEHIENDRVFLEVLRRKMVRGGRLIVTVPAFMFLWSSEDDAAGHFRRYRINPLRELLETCGFEVDYQSYYMGFLLIPVLFFRVFFERMGLVKRTEERSREESDKIYQSQFKSKSWIVNIALYFFEGIERRLMKKAARVPFGSSIIVICSKH